MYVFICQLKTLFDLSFCKYYASTKEQGIIHIFSPPSLEEDVYFCSKISDYRLGLLISVSLKEVEHSTGKKKILTSLFKTIGCEGVI